MKIFNNFDTKLKSREYSYALNNYGSEHVILIQRTFAFWMINGIIPFFIFLAIAFGFFYVHFKYIQKFEFFSYISIGILILLIFFILRHLINTYLDYLCDFTIVTREGISSFKQLGFFNSKNKDLPAGKIRSISSNRDGLIGNIFGYGNIEIITDGSVSSRDEEGSHLGGKMTMTYVKYPNELRKEIIAVCLMKK